MYVCMYTQIFKYFDNVYYLNNIFSFFLLKIILIVHMKSSRASHWEQRTVSVYYSWCYNNNWQNVIGWWKSWERSAFKEFLKWYWPQIALNIFAKDSPNLYFHISYLLCWSMSKQFKRLFQQQGEHSFFILKVSVKFIIFK